MPTCSLEGQMHDTMLAGIKNSSSVCRSSMPNQDWKEKKLCLSSCDYLI